MAFYNNKKDRHFRNRSSTINKGNKIEKKNHPHYIIGEEKNHYLALGITHDRKKGKGHNNHPLTKNPNKYDPEPSYMKKQIECAHKGAYSKYKLNYRLSDIDELYVDSLIAKNKKYKK